MLKRILVFGLILITSILIVSSNPIQTNLLYQLESDELQDSNISVTIENQCLNNELILLPGPVSVNEELKPPIHSILLDQSDLPAFNQYAITNINQEKDWYFVSINLFMNDKILDNWSIMDSAWLGLMLLHQKTNGIWEGAVEGTQTFSYLLEQIPDSIVDQKSKQSLDPLKRQTAPTTSYIFPWEAGKKMYYGKKFLHSAEYDWEPSSYMKGWLAVDFCSYTDRDSGWANNKVYAAASGVISYICRGSINYGIRIDDLLYLHLHPNPNLQENVTYFNQGDFIGTLVTNGFPSDGCGYAEQDPNQFHLHLGFPNNNDFFYMENWKLKLSGSFENGKGLWYHGSDSTGHGIYTQFVSRENSVSPPVLNFSLRLNQSENGHDSEVKVTVQDASTYQIVYGPATVNTDYNGNFSSNLSLTNVTPGKYHICTKAKYYLGQCKYNIEVKDTTSSIYLDFSDSGSNPAHPGDVDIYGGDNKVNHLDSESFMIDFRKYFAQPNQRFDFDRNNILNARDYSLLLGTWNYVSTGEGTFTNSLLESKTEKTNLETESSSNGSISIDPQYYSKTVGDEFTMVVKFDTGGSTSVGADAVIVYDPLMLEIVDQDLSTDGVQISNGSIFPTVYQNSVDNSNGQINFSAGSSNDAAKFNGIGNLATIKALIISSSDWSTSVIPIASINTSTDSNGSEYDTGYDIISSSSIGYIYTSGSPMRQTYSTILTPASNSHINSDFLTLNAQFTDPTNQVNCVDFWTITKNNSIQDSDCTKVDGWQSIVNLSNITDQKEINIYAIPRHQTSAYSITPANNENIILDRTPPVLQETNFPTSPIVGGDSLRFNLQASDNLSSNITVTVWINPSNDGSESEVWQSRGSATIENNNISEIVLDSSGLTMGTHLVKLELIDQANNHFYENLELVISEVADITRIYLPMTKK